MIPKIIHQTFYTKNLPSGVQSVIDNMKKNNPDYQYNFHDDEDIDSFIRQEFGGYIYDAYKKLNIGAAKSDFWRYCVLYKKGGIYIDIDSEFYGKFDDLINYNDEAVISREANENLFVQWCLIFSPNHPILKKCIDKCVANILNPKNLNILHITGPAMFSQCVYEYASENNLLQNPWLTQDDELCNLTKSLNSHKFRFFSTDFKGFCKFKNKYQKEIEEFNINNNKPIHWTKENKIFI